MKRPLIAAVAVALSLSLSACSFSIGNHESSKAITFENSPDKVDSEDRRDPGNYTEEEVKKELRPRRGTTMTKDVSLLKLSGTGTVAVNLLNVSSSEKDQELEVTVAHTVNKLPEHARKKLVKEQEKHEGRKYSRVYKIDAPGMKSSDTITVEIGGIPESKIDTYTAYVWKDNKLEEHPAEFSRGKAKLKLSSPRLFGFPWRGKRQKLSLQRWELNSQAFLRKTSTRFETRNSRRTGTWTSHHAHQG